MEHRNVGRSGLITSVVGLGCNNFGTRIDREQSAAVVHAALDAGYTMFDTANSYGDGASEEFLGAALGAHRDDVVVATKFASSTGDGPYRRGASRRHVISACEASLRRLGTDHIDLYYLHRPDPLTPIEETLAALDALVSSGKVRYIASSNLAAWQVADADHLAARRGVERFIAAQVEWSLLSRAVEAEVVPACRHFGVGVIPYFPLASGLLTGKYRRGAPFPAGSRLAGNQRYAATATDDRLAAVERLLRVAQAHGRSLTELAMSWLAAQPGVPTVLAGASNPDQVRQNAAAVSWELTDDVLVAVDAALLGDGADV